MGSKQNLICTFKLLRSGFSIELTVVSILVFSILSNQIQRQLNQQGRILIQEKNYWEQRKQALKIIQSESKIIQHKTMQRDGYYLRYSRVKQCYYVRTPNAFYLCIYSA